MFLQVLVIVTTIVATFVIPISHLNQLHNGWIYMTLVGNFFFMLLQTVCLIDLSGSLCKALHKMASCSKLWRMIEVTLAIIILREVFNVKCMTTNHWKNRPSLTKLVQAV